MCYIFCSWKVDVAFSVPDGLRYAFDSSNEAHQTRQRRAEIRIHVAAKKNRKTERIWTAYTFASKKYKFIAIFFNVKYVFG